MATLFFNDQPGWTSCTGDVEIIEGQEAAALNKRNKDLTLRVTPRKWLSWSTAGPVPSIIELDGDVEPNPPETWFKI